MVSDNGNPLAEVPGQQASHVSLPRFIDNYDVELLSGWIETLGDARERHDPHRHRVARFREQRSRLCLQRWHALPCALPDPPLCLRPALKRLACAQIDTSDLT